VKRSNILVLRSFSLPGPWAVNSIGGHLSLDALDRASDPSGFLFSPAVA